jgi:hypothetical protein
MDVELLSQLMNAIHGVSEVSLFLIMSSLEYTREKTERHGSARVFMPRAGSDEREGGRAKED